MKKNLFCIFSVGLIAVLSSVSAFAQRENRQTVGDASSLYVISAKAGGVNYVEGKVTITRKKGKSGYLLKGDALEIGDKVSTAADGKAEILLNPGSFVRLAENSGFEFTTTSLEDLQIKLTRGSAMFEVITDNEFQVAVNMPKAKFYIIQSGVYRVDVLNGTDKIEVWKGRAQVGDEANATLIKSGRQATVDGNQVVVAKFDRDDKDALEIFSKSRAKELAKVNARLQNSAMRTSLMSSFYRTRWSLYDSYGLWVYSSFYGSYCFLPFGYGWSSPYGYSYPRDIWSYNLPRVIYNSPPPPVNTPESRVRLNTGSTLSDKVRDPSNSREQEQGIRSIPPYQKVQSEIGRDPVREQQIYSPSFPTNFPSAQPSSPPPPSSPSIISPSSAPRGKGDN